MKIKMEHKVIVAKTKKELEDKMIELLKDDWILNGDVSITYDSLLSGTNQSHAYYQCLFKRKIKKY